TEYLVKAGQKATSRFANAEAITHFDRALELAAGTEQEEQIRLLRAAVHGELFHGTAAEADYTWLLERGEARHGRPAILTALLGLSWAYYLLALDDQEGIYMPRAIACSEQALALTAELGDTRGRVQALTATMRIWDIAPDDRPLPHGYAEEALRLA